MKTNASIPISVLTDTTRNRAQSLTSRGVMLVVIFAAVVMLLPVLLLWQFVDPVNARYAESEREF